MKNREQFEAMLKGMEFERDLVKMMMNHPDFSEVAHGKMISNTSVVPGIQAIYQERNIILVECKVSSALSDLRLNNVIKHLLSYKRVLPGANLILAFPGEMNNIQYTKLLGYGITIWDLPTMAKIFSNQVPCVQSEWFRTLLLTSRQKSIITKEDELLKQLTNCPKGHSNWMIYQNLCKDIFEYLFSPPLGRPITELSDYSRANRRDIIFPNYCEEGFWSFLKSRYKADYLVIDAKNHSSKIDKSFVLQMANYLKDYGPGMFGIIACRTGPKESAVHTRGEIWMAQQKLILFINDSDIERMLLSKRSSNNPEEIIRQKIEDFRLSL